MSTKRKPIDPKDYEEKQFNNILVHTAFRKNGDWFAVAECLLCKSMFEHNLYAIRTERIRACAKCDGRRIKDDRPLEKWKNERFDSVVIKRVFRGRGNKLRAEYECDCGSTSEADLYDIRKSRIPRCGKCARRATGKANFKEFTDKRLIRFTPALNQQVALRAKRDGTTVSSLIRTAVGQYVTAACPTCGRSD